ncbi:MAG: hypothetical protein U5K54_18225 [Cytophagales bacterium]|nr:hypothetical protein [Cytophagales bacterium]
MWTKISGPGTVVFNPTAGTANATATVSLNGVYVLRWTVTNGACSSFSEIQVDYGTDPGPQNAGTDNTFCGLTGTLNATAPVVGNIVWTQVSGPSPTIFTPVNIRNPSGNCNRFWCLCL